MKRLLNVLWVFSGLLVLCSANVNAQQEFRSEEELIKQASKLFGAADYAGALPLYSNIVSNRPDNAEYNYRFGVCMVEAGAEKEDAVRYLKLASTSPQTPEEVTLYLARALHAGGFFEEALESLERYRTVASRSEWSNSIAEELEGNCHTGIAMRVNTTGVEHRILSVKECTLENFHQYYQFNDAWGKFLKVPKQYESKESTGTPEGTYLFISADGGTMLLARTDDKNSSGFDIYRAQKEITGRFSEPVKLPLAVNSPNVNEAFATVSGQGGTMYFSRRGKGSMGGYDIFMTKLQTAAGSWSEPVNMGVPVNSPANDMFYVPAKDGNSCFFLSDRNSPAGGYQVVKANITGLNDKTTMVNGKIDCRSCPSNMEIRVSVTSVSDKSLAKEFKVIPESPVYSVRLQAPETYIFTVSAPGFPVFTDVVEFPELSRSGYLQQILITRDDNGKEAMRIYTQKTDESLLAARMDAKAGDEQLQSSLIAQKVDEMVITEDVDRPAPAAYGQSNSNNDTQDLAGIEISGQAVNKSYDGQQVRDTQEGVANDQEQTSSALASASPSATGNTATGNREQRAASGEKDEQGSDDLSRGEVDLPEINIDTDGDSGNSTQKEGIAAKPQAGDDTRLGENINSVNSIIAGEVVLGDNSNEQDVIRGEFGADATDINDAEEEMENAMKEQDGVVSENESTGDDSELNNKHTIDTVADEEGAVASNAVKSTDGDTERNMSDMQQVDPAATGVLDASDNADPITGEFDASMVTEGSEDESGSQKDDAGAALSTDKVVDNTRSDDPAVSETDEKISADADRKADETAAVVSASANNIKDWSESESAGNDTDDRSEGSGSATADNEVSSVDTAKKSQAKVVNDGSGPGSLEQGSGTSTPVVAQNGDDGDDVMSHQPEGTEVSDADHTSAGRQQMNGVEAQSTDDLDVVADNNAITGEFDAAMAISGDDDPELAAPSGAGERNASAQNNDETSGADDDPAGEDMEGTDPASAGNRQPGATTEINTGISTSAGIAENAAASSIDVADAIMTDNEVVHSTASDINTEAEEPVLYSVTDEARTAYPGLVFKVQVGAFNKADAEQLVSYFREKGLNLLTNAVNESGMTTVMTGSFPAYEDARSQRDRIRQEGYEDAFVVVFDGQNRLNISDVIKPVAAE